MITITLRNKDNEQLPVFIDISEGPLQTKWLQAFNDLIKDGFHLEKNYHWIGFPERDVHFLCGEINKAFQAINDCADHWISKGMPPYVIHNNFTVRNTTNDAGYLLHDKTNKLHRYFEDLQGTNAGMSSYYLTADSKTKWWIRQLNLLCHEYESAVITRKKIEFQKLPEWAQYNQLFCFLNAPRFVLEPEDMDLFGIESIARDFGGVYMGINKAVGKNHFEVFQDEGDASELVTTVLRAQSQGAGDFDISWSQSTKTGPWVGETEDKFREWLITNGFDPKDPELTLGHPKIGEVDLMSSFGTDKYTEVQNILTEYNDVCIIETDKHKVYLDYRWTDADYPDRQLSVLEKGYKYVSR